MIRYQVVDATEGHAEELIMSLSPDDRLECEALGVTAKYALAQSMRVSRDPKTFLVDGKVAAMFGVGNRDGTWLGAGRPAMPWLLSSTMMRGHGVHFLRGCKLRLDAWLEEYEHLRGHVDARHSVSVRWLKWLGFTIHPAKPHGGLRGEFHMFERTL